jgi:hypothetical protein
MKLIKDYMRFLDQADPYQDQWMNGEQPIITAVQIDPTETDTQIIEQLQSKVNELEERVKFLEEALFDEE